MGFTAVVAAVLLSSAPDLSVPPRVAVDAGPFQAPELVGAGVGVLAADALWLGAAAGTFRLFTSGAVSATASHYRHAAFGLAGTALLLPPIGAMLGGMLGRSGPAYGAAWKAFLLALAGQAAALTAGLLLAPAYWAVIPVQLALMTTGTSVGLHWGSGPRRAAEVRHEPAAPAPPAPVALSAPICPDET
jgi:hypothetical protein